MDPKKMDPKISSSVAALWTLLAPPLLLIFLAVLPHVSAHLPHVCLPAFLSKVVDAVPLTPEGG